MKTLFAFEYDYFTEKFEIIECPVLYHGKDVSLINTENFKFKVFKEKALYASLKEEIDAKYVKLHSTDTWTDDKEKAEEIILKLTEILEENN